MTILLLLNSGLILVQNFVQNRSPNRLTDIEWKLLKIEISETTEIQFADTSCNTYIRFDNNGHYKGYTGWNWYFGDYSISDSTSLSINNSGSTEKMGSPNCKLGESLFKFFSLTREYKLNSDTLILVTTENNKLYFRK